MYHWELNLYNLLSQRPAMTTVYYGIDGGYFSRDTEALEISIAVQTIMNAVYEVSSRGSAGSGISIPVASELFLTRSLQFSSYELPL